MPWSLLRSCLSGMLCPPDMKVRIEQNLDNFLQKQLPPIRKGTMELPREVRTTPVMLVHNAVMRACMHQGSARLCGGRPYCLRLAAGIRCSHLHGAVGSLHIGKACTACMDA